MFVVLFTRGNGWLGKVIRFFTKSKFNHVAFTYYDENFGQDMVVEAITSGFHVRPLSKLLSDSTIVHRVTLANHYKPLPILAKWLDKRYDFGGLIGEAFVKIAQLFKRRIKNPLASSSALFCSESAVKLLQELGYPGAETLVAETTDPQMLYDFLQK